MPDENEKGGQKVIRNSVDVSAEIVCCTFYPKIESGNAK